MPKYQVQYQNNSKTFTDLFEANSETELKSLFVDLINAEILEIREIVYTNNTYPKDDGDYKRPISCSLHGLNGTYYKFKIPKVSKLVSTQQIQSLCESTFKISSLKPQKVVLFL